MPDFLIYSGLFDKSFLAFLNTKEGSELRAFGANFFLLSKYKFNFFSEYSDFEYNQPLEKVCPAVMRLMFDSLDEIVHFTRLI